MVSLSYGRHLARAVLRADAPLFSHRPPMEKCAAGWSSSSMGVYNSFVINLTFLNRSRTGSQTASPLISTRCTFRSPQRVGSHLARPRLAGG